MRPDTSAFGSKALVEPAPTQYEFLIRSNSVTPAKRRRIWPLIIGAMCLVLVPTANRAVRPEIARWYLAAAEDELIDGIWYARRRAESDGAIEENRVLAKRAILRADRLLEESVSWGGRSWHYFTIRSRRDRVVGNVDTAILNLEEAIKRAPPTEKYALLSLLASLELRRRSVRAIGLYKNILESVESSSDQRLHSNALNGLAYSRAIHRFELDAALKDIDQAIEIHEALVADLQANSWRASWFSKPTEPEPIDATLIQFRDTRGFILLGLGNKKAARAQFDIIWKSFDDWFKQQQSADAAFLINERKSRVDIRMIPNHLGATHHSAAVIMYHRMLTLDRNADQKELESLDKRIRSLGYEPTRLLF
jgi:tetratricopeptide (TPR) repeat protein